MWKNYGSTTQKNISSSKKSNQNGFRFLGESIENVRSYESAALPSTLCPFS